MGFMGTPPHNFWTWALHKKGSAAHGVDFLRLRELATG